MSEKQNGPSAAAEMAHAILEANASVIRAGFVAQSQYAKTIMGVAQKAASVHLDAGRQFGSAKQVADLWESHGELIRRFWASQIGAVSTVSEEPISAKARKDGGAVP